MVIMKKSPARLPGEYYFIRDILPVALKRVHGNALSHPHNYTGIPHRHDFSELVVITAGSGRQNIDGKSRAVSAGDVFVIAGKTTHYFESFENLEITNIMFSEHVFRDQSRYLNRIPGYQLIFRIEPELRACRGFRNTLRLSPQKLAYVSRVCDRIQSEQELRQPGYEAAVVSELLNLTIFLSRSADEQEAASRSGTRLASLLSMLEADFQEDWPLKRMASCAGMSLSTLLRAFRTVLRKSPLQYLTELRLSAAEHRLWNSDLSISEIAYACGFHDSNYFTKCFQAHFHRTPTQYRKHSWETRPRRNGGQP